MAQPFTIGFFCRAINDSCTGSHSRIQGVFFDVKLLRETRLLTILPSCWRLQLNCATEQVALYVDYAPGTEGLDRKLPERTLANISSSEPDVQSKNSYDEFQGVLVKKLRSLRS